MILLAPILLSGCSETCAPPQPALNQKVWSVFVQPTTFTINGEGFPADSTPANGTHEMIIAWSSPQADSPIVVTIDGQPFDGAGKWSEQECGNFTMTFDGIYTGDDGSTHAFGAGAQLMTWSGRLEGFLDWSENWANAAGEIGSYTTDAQLFGIPESEAEDTGNP
jgi:hypothetical protein